MKFILYITICLCLVVYWFFSISNPKLEKFGGDYITIFSTCVVWHQDIVSVTSLGFAHAYTIRTNRLDRVRPLFRNIDGESITLSGKEKDQVLLLFPHHNYVSSQRLGNMVVTNLYSNRGLDFIMDGRNRINLQVAKRGDVVTIGWPVILGGF